MFESNYWNIHIKECILHLKNDITFLFYAINSEIQDYLSEI